MSASVVMRNDGPDDCEVELGRRRILLRAGDELRVVTQVARLHAIPPPDPIGAWAAPREPMRMAEE